MYEKAQTLTARAAAGVLGAVMAVSLVFGAFVPSTQAQTLDELMAQIAALQAQLTGLQGGSSTTSTGGYVNHPNVDFMFNVDLTVGSKGNDVMMLQKALNDGGWTVATSGAGSKGMETTTFGPATKAAVAKFQVAKGITPAAGYFGPKTRMEMNKKGTGSTGTSTVTGDKLVASEGNDVEEMDIAPGQRRVLFTTLVLSAGDKDVTVDEIHVEVEGEDSDSDTVVEQVLVWDSKGVIWDEDAPDSDDMAELMLDGLEIADGKSVTLYIGANIDAGTGEDDQDTALTVVAIEASSPVDGLPVSGVEHTLNDQLTLEDFAFDIDNETGDVQIGDKEEMVATVNVDNNNADESIFVNSFTLEQVGDVSTSDLDNITAWIDGDEDNTVEAEVNGDMVSFIFDDAVEIEEGEDMDFEIYVDVTDGSGDTISFDVDDIETDLDVVDEDDRVLEEDGSYVYDADEVDITAGEGSSSDSNDVSSGNIAVGEEGAEFASFDLEVEGEDITGDMTITFAVTQATGLSADDVELDNVAIMDGEDEIANADEITVTGAAPNFTITAEFEDITFPATDDEVTFVIIADVSDDVVNDVEYEVTDIDFDNFEGDDSGDPITGMDTTGTDLTPNVTQTVKGASLEIGFSNSIDNDEVKDDKDEVEIALVQLDASDSGEEITVNDVQVTITVGGLGETVDQLSNCALFLDDEKVSDEEDPNDTDTSEAIKFELDDVMVPAEDVLVLSLRCDLNDDFEAGDTIDVTLAGGDINEADADAEISDDVTPVAGNTAAPTITIVDGQLEATDGSEPDMETALAGATVSLGTVDLKAEDINGVLEELTLEISGSGAEDLLGSSGKVMVYKGTTHVADAFFTSNTEYLIDSWKSEVKFNTDQTIELEFKAALANTIGTEGDTVAVNVSNAVDGALLDGDEYTLTATTLNGVAVYSALPTFAKETIDSSDISDNQIMRFAITATGDDLVLDGANFLAALTVDVTGTALTGVETIWHGGSWNEAEDEDDDITATGDLVIDEGDTEYFVVKGTAVTGGDDGDIIEVTMDFDGLIAVDDDGTFAGGDVISPIEGTNINSSEEMVSKYTN